MMIKEEVLRSVDIRIRESLTESDKRMIELLFTDIVPILREFIKTELNAQLLQTVPQPVEAKQSDVETTVKKVQNSKKRRKKR